MKALPYGISDFPRIRCEDYYYVDKSRFIEILERQPPYLFLIRPRRFGKSLFLAMLEAYYSIDYAGRFEELFGELYIGQHPTKRHNSYMVLRFNFSEVSSKLEFVDRSFCEYCCMVMKNFILKYEHLLGSGIWEVVNPDETNPEQMLAALKEYVSRTDCPRIYLLIDEYDNFTNTILSSYGQERYREKTHGEGLIRGFFNNVKASTSNAGAAVERLFITGVSPITMDDVTSGFNIGTNISMLPQFNDIIGFSEDEVREMITYYKDENALPADVTVDELVELMKPWYDNYCFSEDSLEERMFNSDMTLYFLNNYLQLGKVPKMMVDNNIRTDYINKTIAEIVKTKPSYITIEDLNVSGMMKNKHLSRAVASQKFYEFRIKLKAKSKENGIELRVADRWYPSSKICHCCGTIKKDLKLSDRTFRCHCGYVEDRDFNAALNLRDVKTYKIA